MATRKQDQEAVQKQIRLPVPVGGINTVDNVMAVGPEYGYLIDNFITRPFGLEVRKGYREWLPTASALPAEVVTLMGYKNTSGSVQKRFAATGDANNSIYDISTPNVAPPAPFQAGTGAIVEGEWSWLNYMTPAGAYLCAVLHGVGYFLYDAVNGWRQVEDGSGSGKIEFVYGGTTYDSSEMFYVFGWKNRLWFLQADTGLAWYLPVNQITGKATAIDLGQFLRHGGGLSFACNWTYDSGEGIDDNLVFVGAEGDMVIYQGTDPSQAATFQIKGIWFIGRVPVGRRGWNQYGGDVLILTEFGIVSVSDFVSGRITNPQGQSSVAEKFNPSLARYISETISVRYWQVVTYPSEELVVVISPAVESTTGIPVSFVMSHFNKAWSTISRMPMNCGIVYNGKFAFGAKNGMVYLGFDGYRDGDDYLQENYGNEITGQFLATFQDYGSSTSNKRAQRIRLVGRAEGNPGYVAAIRSEFSPDARLEPPAPVIQGGALWDVALWDSDLWYARSAPFKKWFGVAGFGKKLAAQVAMRGLGQTVLTDYEVTFEEGIGL